MRRLALIIPALILGLSFTAPSTAEARKAKYCQGDHLHYGTSDSFKSKKQAFRDAIASWAGFTVFEYGEAWGHWRLSINKAVNCKNNGGLWKCSIQSTPCRKATKADGRKKFR